MKFTELVESVSSQQSFIELSKELNALTIELVKFNDIVNAIGYDAARKLIQQQINNSISRDWYYKLLATSNPKTNQLFNKLVSARTQLQAKINSGV
jgi:DNA-directed RNA polymerase delta subunit